MATTESLSCNNCGAPLEVPTGARYVTCAHCGSRLAIKRTESAAYTEALEDIDRHAQHMSSDLEAIRLQNELEQIDREWQIEREQYLTRSRDGSTGVPSKGITAGGIVGIVLVIGFLIFWIALASAGALAAGAFGFGFGGISPVWCFPLFGVGMLLVLILNLSSAQNNAA